MRDYDPADWYWIVAGDETRPYASAWHAYVPADDKDYTAFAAAGGHPTRIASEAELREVLLVYRRALFAGEKLPPTQKERIETLERENAALKAALIKKALITDADLAAERSAS